MRDPGGKTGGPRRGKANLYVWYYKQEARPKCPIGHFPFPVILALVPTSLNIGSMEHLEVFDVNLELAVR